MSRFSVEVLPDGRQVTTEAIIRECDGYTGSLAEFLSRIDARLPKPEAKRLAKIALHDGHLVISISTTESDAELAERRKLVAA